uniref:Uncharacterized protein n=1 Tax=Setaria viridis TaxID=4556 RepID=A0A4U6TER3_SETVI|nr:hypothetical protein SEVIR_8G048500v2 [Setaria viridis]
MRCILAWFSWDLLISSEPLDRAGYCPAIDMKQLYKRQQQVLDNLEHKNISHAHSSGPWEGPKLREPKSWKYAIPWCQKLSKQRH